MSSNEASTSSPSGSVPTEQLAGLSVDPSRYLSHPTGEQADTDAYNGQLPDFSDDESSTPPTASSSKPKKVGTGRKLISKIKGRGGPPPGGSKPKPKPVKAKDKADIISPGLRETVANHDDGDDDGEEGGTLEMTEEMLQMVMAQLKQQGQAGTLSKEQVQAMVQGKASTQAGKQLEKDMSAYKFWNTQPVPKIGVDLDEIREGPLEPNKTDDEVSKDPVPLHSDFKWVTLDLGNPTEVSAPTTELVAGAPS